MQRITMGIMFLALAACGGPKNSSGASTEQTEFRDQKPVRQTQVSGIATCTERVNPQSIQGRIYELEVEVQGKAQRVLRSYCAGEAFAYSEIPAVDLNISTIIGSYIPDIIIVRNRTTCTERTRLMSSDTQAAKALDQKPGVIVPAGEIRSTKVLPIGMELSETSELSLDPNRINYLEVVLQTCDQWETAADGVRNCSVPVTVFTKNVAVKVKFSGQHYRGVRVEAEENCNPK